MPFIQFVSSKRQATHEHTFMDKIAASVTNDEGKLLFLGELSRYRIQIKMSNLNVETPCSSLHPPLLFWIG